MPIVSEAVKKLRHPYYMLVYIGMMNCAVSNAHIDLIISVAYDKPTLSIGLSRLKLLAKNN